jgi:hypothetical protein
VVCSNLVGDGEGRGTALGGDGVFELQADLRAHAACREKKEEGF